MKHHFLILAALCAAVSCGKKPAEAESTDWTVVQASIENPSVAAYMAAVAAGAYPYGIYSAEYPSVVKDYCTETSESNRLDHPAPVSISWTAVPGTVKQTLRIAEDKELSIGVRELGPEDGLTEASTSFDIYNLIPGKTYYCKVFAEDIPGNISTAGAFELRPEGRIRMLRAGGIYNVRDLGGRKAVISGHEYTLRYGQLFRGSRLSKDNAADAMITPEGLRALRREGIRTELDLREDAEAGNISASVLGGEDYPTAYFRNGEVSWPYFYESCDQMDAYIKLTRIAMHNLPAYFHCSVGADRTGTLAFLIGGLLGMSESELASDYELTSFCPLTPQRYRTDGRWDYPGMVATVAAIDGNPALSQMDFYLYFWKGVRGPEGNYRVAVGERRSERIPSSELKTFIKHMTGCDDAALQIFPDDQEQ